MSLLDASPSPFHAVAECSARLTAAGGSELSLADEWDSSSVDGFRFVRRDGALIAWKAPTTLAPAPDMLLVGAHTDSPCFKLKPNPDVQHYGWHQLAVEVYGGILNNSWLDRDLGLAGRVVNDAGETTLVRTDAIARIPQLAIHLDRGVNEGLRLDPQTHLMPIWSVDQVGESVVEHLQRLSGFDSIAWWDVSLFDTQPAARLGSARELLASGRLDNLVSCWAAVAAFSATSHTDQLQMIVLNDHEEVGSTSSAGADGTMLQDTLMRVYPDEQDRLRTMAHSMLISTDNAHGVHPNYPSKHDAQHGPILNDGPVIKINANQRYATSSDSHAWFAHLCQTHDIPYQKFVTRADMGCGSTIGPITAAKLGIQTIDVGAPTFAMHSIRETAGTEDATHLLSALTHFLSLKQAPVSHAMMP